MKRQAISALHTKPVAELSAQLIELQTKLYKARLQKSAGKSKNPAEVKELADDVARIKTVISAQKLTVSSVQTSAEEEK